MSESSTLLLSYYKLQELSENIKIYDKSTIIQNISNIIETVSKVNCDNPYDCYLLGLIYQLSGKIVKNYDKNRNAELINNSILFFERAISLRKTNFSTISTHEIYLNLGNARYMLYHPDQGDNARKLAQISESDYNNALLSKNPDIIYKAFIGLSYANYVLGNYESGIENATKAINYFKKINHNPKDLASVYNNRGLNYASLSKTDQSKIEYAFSDFNNALKEVPDFIEAISNIENLHSSIINGKIEAKNFEEAEKDLTTISNVNTKLILLHNLANAYYQDDKEDKALEILENIWAIEPINSASVILYCSILNSKGELDEKKSDKLKSISDDDLFYPSAQNLMGCIYYSQ